MSKFDQLSSPEDYSPKTLTFRRFSFRSQSLRFRKNSKSFSSSNGSLIVNNNNNNNNTDTLVRQRSSTNAGAASIISSNSSTHSQLNLTDRDLIISNHQPLVVHDNNNNKSGDAVRKTKKSTLNRLTRHQSIKLFINRSESNQSLSSSSSSSANTTTSSTSQYLPKQRILNISVGNFPPKNIITNKNSQDNEPVLEDEDDHVFEDEGVVTHEDSDDEDEDFLMTCNHQDDQQHSCESIHYNGGRMVQLRRHPNIGLGISITGGCDQQFPITVMAIKSNSPAEKSGQIFIGDQIVSVNEVPLNENTSHQDALRLLSECGPLITLKLKHTKAVISVGKKCWKRKCYPLKDDLKYSNNDNNNNTVVDGRKISFPNQQTNNIRKEDDENDDLNNKWRINLFLARITQYVSYSDKIRDSSFEIHQYQDGKSVVINCMNRIITDKWFKAIKSNVQYLTKNFIQQFNKHFPESEHFFYMGFVDELVPSESTTSSSLSNSLLSILSPNHHQVRRWLPRYWIIKGDKIYMFQTPPFSTLLNYKRKILSAVFHSSRHSNGSSLGSVGSSGSANTNDSMVSNGQLDQSAFSLKPRTKPDRLFKLNQCLDNELQVLSIEHWTCHNSAFRSVKSINESKDNRQNCFLVYSGKFKNPRYFSIECSNEFSQLQEAWDICGYQSVIKLESKTFTVVLDKDNIIGSLKIDWNSGFSFYDPKRNILLWSFGFDQLKQSSDDGNNLLSLTFLSDLPPNPSQPPMVMSYVLRCSCLQAIICCMDTFLRAKIYKLFCKNVQN